MQGFDGTTAWTINPFAGGDDPQKMGKDETSEMRSRADLGGALVADKAKGTLWN